jgi:hypothetical protein
MAIDIFADWLVGWLVGWFGVFEEGSKAEYVAYQKRESKIDLEGVWLFRAGLKLLFE